MRLRDTYFLNVWTSVQRRVSNYCSSAILAPPVQYCPFYWSLTRSFLHFSQLENGETSQVAQHYLCRIQKTHRMFQLSRIRSGHRKRSVQICHVSTVEPDESAPHITEIFYWYYLWLFDRFKYWQLFVLSHRSEVLSDELHVMQFFKPCALKRLLQLQNVMTKVYGTVYALV